MQALLRKIRQILKDRRTRRFFTRFVASVAAIVVFVTTYALILPAITLEKTAVCGVEEHQHSDSCYEEKLVCGQEESDGHHHAEGCYSVTRELVCEEQEHQHSSENGCYDADGNLMCELQEHVHDDSCYEEVRTLTCGLKESEGHHHTDDCYEKVLVCGKEVHTHSEKCYVEDGSNDGDTDANTGDTSDGTSSDSADAGDTATAAYVPDATTEEAQPESYVPELDPLDMEAVLNGHTDFYYFHAEEGKEVPADSAEITEWKKVGDGTKLESTDLVKAYFAYTIPAGSLNETNATARYRMPGNLHLSDQQIDAMNRYENGIAAGYRDSDAASENYHKYLGAEAIEGDRRPDEQPGNGAQEYISAVVRAENVYNDNGKYLGQELIFTFIPYSIEKNRNTYDADQTLVSAGEKITGWFACDFRLDQIDWESETEIANASIENTENAAGENITEENQIAKVVFAEEDQKEGIKEISRRLRLSGQDTKRASDEAQAETSEDTGKDGEDENDQIFKSGTLTAEGDDYKIILDYSEEAKIPENASLSVREITAETDKEAYEACLAQAGQQVAADDQTSVDQKASRFFDIEILATETDSDGTEKTVKIEPAAPVSVYIQINDTPAVQENKSEQSEPTVLHFAEEGVEQIDSTASTDSAKENNSEGTNTEISFEAESFSIYGVVYTVDFHWEVNGETYDFSMPGGGFISFYDLVEKLGIGVNDTNTEKDEIQELVDGVESITFSAPELVSVSKVEEDTTVGAIKDGLDLECEYSAELTEKDIEEINALEVGAGDWALISLKPFDTEESLTVTMMNGEVWTVKVTDAWNDWYYQKSFKVTVSPANSGTVWFNNNWYYTGTEVWGNTNSNYEFLGGGTNESDILAQANDGYVFDHWELNGNLFNNGSLGQLEDGTPLNVIEAGKLFVGNNDNWVVTAVYRPSSTLSVTAGEGGSVSAETIPINNAGFNADKITATANDGYWFDHWELDSETVELEDGMSNAADGSNSIISTNKLHVGTDDGHVLHAVFVPETNFEINASEGGAVNISSSARTKDGYNKSEIKATAEDGYWFDHWEVDGSTVSGEVTMESDGSSCTAPAGSIQVGDGEILTAVFIEEVKYDVEAVNAEGGSIGTCTVKVGEGTPASTIADNDMNRAGNNVDSITASAGPGYVFKEWQLDGTPILGGATITTASDGSSSTIDAGTLHIGTEAGHKVTAVFAQEYTFTVSTSPKGAGTVKDDGKTPGETIFGSMTKDGHNKYEIKATAQNGYKFSHWTMNGQVLKDDADNELYTNGTIPAGALTLTSSDNICAVFVKNTYTITVTNAGNGSTNVSSRQTESNSKVEKKANGTIIAYPNYGYKFAYWKVEESDAIVDWGDGCSAASSTIQPTVNRDITVTAVFVPDSYRTFTVTVDDPSHGTVFGKDANRNDVSADGVTSYVARTRGNNNNNNDQRIQVQTTFGGYEFVGWELVRSNGKVYQSYDNNNKLKGWRIDANSLNIPEDNMTLRAVFKEREVVPFDDPTMDDLVDWANGIADTDFSTDKTAEVFDYDNRIYKLSMSASSKKQAIDSSVVINFITDVSRSMYFPANITEVGDYGNSYGNTTGADLQRWLNGKSTDQVYYIILSQNKTATMYAVYHDGSQWRYVDASYYAPNSDDGLTMAGYPVSGVTPATGDNYKIYQAPPREAGKPWSRLDYLCMSVEAAADVIYTICPNAQIDLTTFNRSAQYMGTLPTDHAGIEAMLRDIDVSGGTRQDLGLEKALPHFTNGSSKKQVAVLITDGAPNPADGNMTKIWQDINTFAGQMKDITDADGDHLELYTMGLSLKNVGDNEAKLNAIATEDPDSVGVYPNKYAKSVNSGQETSEAVKEIVNSLLNDVSLFGSMTDTVDPAFYPVDMNGQPIQAGYYAADGSTLNSVPVDNTPYYEWVNNGGTWTITWHNQTFAWADEETPGWQTNFYVKAKEDFLGGNKISTNEGTNNGLTATGYVKTDTSVTPLKENKTKTFDYTPYVNVDELHMNGNDTEWTVYLGTNVDPKTQLIKLFESIPVKQVVKEGGTTEDIYITSSGQMYYEHGTVIDNADKDEPESNYQTLPLSHYLSYGVSDSTGKNLSGVLNDLLDTLTSSDSATLADIVYTEYGHPAGYFTVSLTKDVNEEAVADHAPQAHETKKPGEGVETYTVNVTYTPYNTTIPADDTYDHTTSGGSSGNITTGSGEDEVESNNSHKINVYTKPFDILKVNEQGVPIAAPKQATFELFRAWTAEDTDTDRKVIFGETEGYTGYKLNGNSLSGEYFRVDTQITDEKGIAHFGAGDDISKLLSSGKGDYILIEKQEPVGYEKDINARTISIETAGTDLNLYSNLSLEPITTAMMPYNWNQGVRFILNENDGETSSQNSIEYVDENGRKYKLYIPGTEETDENLRDYVFSDIDNDKEMIKDPAGEFHIRFLNMIGEMDVVFKKVGVNNTDQTGTQSNLGGAKFTLYEATGTNKDTKGNIVVVDDEAFQDKISDDVTGIFWRGMLPIGDYLLEETEAPGGYNKIGVLIKVTVSEDGVSLGYVGTVGTPPYNEPTKDGDTWTVTAIDTAGAVLPNTGGPGTNMIYLLGIMLMGLACAGLAMIKKGKMQIN